MTGEFSYELRLVAQGARFQQTRSDIRQAVAPQAHARSHPGPQHKPPSIPPLLQLLVYRSLIYEIPLIFGARLSRTRSNRRQFRQPSIYFGL